MTRPTAAPAHFPYAHRTMAEVMAFKHCIGCRDRSDCPFEDDCPRCQEMASDRVPGVSG